tara:strand:- start:238 stop:387 length:150 start_codon:yes stop_codon:yes gene_type:complete
MIGSQNARLRIRFANSEESGFFITKTNTMRATPDGVALIIVRLPLSQEI